MTLIPDRRGTSTAGRRRAVRTLLAAASAFVPALAAGQRPIATEGALDLVLPTGARAVALG